MSIWDAFGKGRYKGFSREAGQLLDKAVELAGGLGCKKADTGHLLWAMLQADGGPAARFLAGKNISELEVRRQLSAGRDGSVTRLARGDMAADLRRAMDYAIIGAQNAHLSRAEPEHLLCAMLEDTDCAAGVMLASMGVQLTEAVRECRQLSGQFVLPAQPRMSSSRTGRPSEKSGRDLTRLAQEGRLDPVLCREAELDQRRREVFARQPRLRDIDRTLRTTMSRIVAAAAKKGEDPLPALRVLRDENLSLQRERAALLEDMGYPADYLEDKPACPLCGDTGYTRSGVCACLKQYYAREQLAELSRLLPLGEARFDTFRFDLYDSAVWDSYGVSPRANMERNFDVCRDFARQFSRGSGSLLLSGGTGLGKTFLSACIAREVSDAGFSVVYDTAISVFSRYEDAKFRPDEVSDADVRRCESCDLLILDDLGTEMTTAFVQSALYQIVNGRMLSGRSTIISTNLAPDELGHRYGAPILSRIEGAYQILPFFGEDIRTKQ